MWETQGLDRGLGCPGLPQGGLETPTYTYTLYFHRGIARGRFFFVFFFFIF